MVTSPLSMTKQELDFMVWAQNSSGIPGFCQSYYVYPIVRLHKNGVGDDILLSDTDERTIVDRYAPEISKYKSTTIRKFRRAIRLYREYHIALRIQNSEVVE